MLPAVRTDEEWQAVVFDEKTVRPGAEDLAARLGLAGAGLRRYPGGSRPVYAVGDRRVLKLYPTVSAPDSLIEARVLDGGKPRYVDAERAAGLRDRDDR
jgi:hygromycin-B 7''-O-kinase